MIKKKNIVLIGLLALGVLVYFLLKEKKDPEAKGSSRYSVHTFDKPTGWSYRIYDDTAAIVEQMYIPGVPGSRGFASEKQAQQTGELVIDKLEKGIFPPSITARELDSMEIDY